MRWRRVGKYAGRAVWFKPTLGCWIVGLVVLCGVGPLCAQMPTVHSVEIINEGPGPLNKASVRSYIHLEEGDEYNPNRVNQDVRALLDTKRFADVTAALEVMDAGAGVKVIYSLRNRPRIRTLRVDGADHVSNRRVRDWLELGVGDRVDDTTLGVRAQKVYEEYRKRYFLDPELTWTIQVDEETGTADVDIQVEEGPRASVSSIEFEGNESLSTWALRGVMNLKGWRPWSFLTKSNRYDPHLLDADRDALRRAYLDRGYLDVRIGEPQIEESWGDRVRVRIPIEEGPVYTISEVDIAGVSLFPEEDVEDVVRLAPGAPASMSRIEQVQGTLRDYYGAQGYIRTGVRYTLEPDYDAAQVAVEYELNEGELSYIRDIHIRGNTRTKDKVIRRELAVWPGDIFNEVRVRRSENRLRNMGYFEVVRSWETATAEPNVYDLTFDVDEGRTGELSAGVGFSSIDQVVGFASIAQNNFDLFGWPYFSGGGQKIQLETQIGSRRTDVSVSFVEPWFLDRQLSLDVSGFRREARFLSDEYEQQNIGGTIGLARPVGRFSRVRLSYSLEEIDVRDVSDSASQVIKDEEGRRTKSAATLTITRDTRDNLFVPTRGNRTVLSGQLAGGVLQAQTDLYALEARTSQFVPLWYGHVFSLRGAVAVVEEYGDSERVPIFDRLFLGGPRDVRGFRFRDVGPKDENGEPIGGRTSAFLSAEYTIPVVSSVRLAAFYDVGTVGSEAYEVELDDVNSAYGVGIRFDIPGFPLRLDYGWPLEADEFNDSSSGRFSFMIGHVF